MRGNIVRIEGCEDDMSDVLIFMYETVELGAFFEVASCVIFTRRKAMGIWT